MLKKDAVYSIIDLLQTPFAHAYYLSLGVYSIRAVRKFENEPSGFEDKPSLRGVA